MNTELLRLIKLECLKIASKYSFGIEDLKRNTQLLINLILETN